jgi:hypothetical protein
MLQVYRFATKKKQAAETSGLCLRKYGIWVFEPTEQLEVPRTEGVVDHIIP